MKWKRNNDCIFERKLSNRLKKEKNENISKGWCETKLMAQALHTHTKKIANLQKSMDLHYWNRTILLNGRKSKENPQNNHILFTSELCDQTICGGGSGANRTMQVTLIVEPLLMNRSGPPCISVMGSVKNRKNKEEKHCALIVYH